MSSQVGMNSHVAAMGLANVAKRAIKLNRNMIACLPDSKMTLNGRKRSGLKLKLRLLLLLKPYKSGHRRIRRARRMSRRPAAEIATIVVEINAIIAVAAPVTTGNRRSAPGTTSTTTTRG